MINKIFQIGFSRCVYYLGGKIGNAINNNIKNNEKTLKGVDGFIFYSDFVGDNGFEGFKRYRELDKDYPNSKFILNIRDFNNYVNTLLKRLYNKQPYNVNNTILNNEAIEIITKLKPNWFTHIEDVKEYFKDRPQDLLIYDLDNDDFSKIKDFFKGEINFTINDFPVIHYNLCDIDYSSYFKDLLD